MASKEKKRKGNPAVPAQETVAVAVESQRVVATAIAEPATAAQDSKSSSKKVKAVKPAPVLTKKPSRLRFFVEAFQELKKAHWPSRREALRLSLLVAVLCVFVGAVLGGIDFVFLKLMGLLLLNG